MIERCSSCWRYQKPEVEHYYGRCLQGNNPCNAEGVCNFWEHQPPDRLMPQEKAVIEAAVKWTGQARAYYGQYEMGCPAWLMDAVDAYLASGAGYGDAPGEG